MGRRNVHGKFVHAGGEISGVPLLRAMVDWECPNCWITDTAPPPPPGKVRFHNCPGLHGLSAPLVQAGISCKVTAEERQDYLAGRSRRWATTVRRTWRSGPPGTTAATWRSTRAWRKRDWVITGERSTSGSGCGAISAASQGEKGTPAVVVRRRPLARARPWGRRKTRSRP